MIFGEIFYSVFLLLTLTVYWVVPHRLRMAVIGVSGLFFYWYYAGAYVVLLFLLTFGSWLVLFARPVVPAPIDTNNNGEIIHSPSLVSFTHHNFRVVA